VKNFLNKAKSYVLKHKILSIVVLVILIFTGRYIYEKAAGTSNETRYVLAQVQKGTIISTVSGTGQVSSSNEVDLKSKASGDVVYVGVTNGQKVKAGTVLLKIDDTDAQKAVRDAEISLENEKLAIQKSSVDNSDANLNADLGKAYDDGFSDLSNALLNLAPVLNGLNDMSSNDTLSDNDVSSTGGRTGSDYKNTAETAYWKAKNAFDKNQTDFAGLNRTSPQDQIDSVLEETYQTAKLTSDAVNDFSILVAYLVNVTGDASTYSSDSSSLSSYTSTTNSNLSSLSSAQTNIKNAKDNLANAGLDRQSDQLTLQQKENSLADAESNLSDYSVVAPFDGTVTNFDVKKNDNISTSAVVATLITNEQFAEISLNEVDVAKIALNDKATLTFDAIPDLTISGTVEEIDSIGTVSQGVVTYNIKIGFDTQDDRVKPSMSVSADIITDVKQDVLEVPNSAVKSLNGQSYVQKFGTLPAGAESAGAAGFTSSIAPEAIPVETGLSNDTYTEIVSGLNEGDEIVARTIAPSSASSAATSAPSLFGGGGGSNRGFGGGGAVRVQTR
jgi:HlyD family secretion protein